MNISFAGLHGTGKSTIAKMIAEHFHFTYYSTGIAFREMAKEKGMTLEEFSKFTEKHPEIDNILDHKIVDMAKDGAQDYIFEGQLPTYMLGDLKDFAIMLTCDEEIRIQRMASRDEEDISEKVHETIVREESEQQRFIELYNIDVMNPALILKTFDLIINTTHLGIEEVYQISENAIAGIINKSK
ncbi:MAG: (d)CMP kinase [Promethearchaeota archaeon]